MQLVILDKHGHAASLMLKNIAIAWNTLVNADAISMPDLLELLKAFRTLAVPFLTDQIKLVQIGEPFFLGYGALDVDRCASQWIRAAVSLAPVQDSADWNRVTHAYHVHMAISYPTSLTQLMIESAANVTSSKTVHLLDIVQDAIPVRNFNTIELLNVAVNMAESQGSASVFKSEVLAAVTDLHWNL
jgi:hypothetical protein